jgi:two-component system, cell cycle sensor histidine kinase and response regulator CckA
MEVPGLTDSVPVTGGNEIILLVDDEHLVLELGSDCLDQMGYTALTATNGKEALQIYRERGSDISLVILDLIMPEMGGFQCFQELLKINSQVKVIIASGLMSEKTHKDAERLGARGFVQKPYDMRQLIAQVRQVLDD